MKKSILLLFHIYLHTILFGQNLVPNGDFEQLECPTNPINSIDTTATWYSVTEADAYWIHEDCPMDEAIAGPIFFIDTDQEAYSGKGYISLEGAMTVSGFYMTEGVGIALTKTLNAGKPYYFEMAKLYQNMLMMPEHPGLNCGDIRDRFVEVHFADEPINFEREIDNIGVVTGISHNVDMTLKDEGTVAGDFEENKWDTFYHCFIANGGEKYIGISGNNFKLPLPNNCFKQDQLGALFLYGYSIDALQLVEVPTEIDTTVSICENGGWVDIHYYVPNPYFDKARYTWEDGCTETRRVIRDTGIYHVEMVLPCVTIPITLRVVYGNGCQEVMYSDEMPYEIEEDIIICNDEAPKSIALLPLIPENMAEEATFQWQDGGTENHRVIEQPGEYLIEVSTECYSFPLKLFVEEQPCHTHIFVPNAFSPNDDGFNDSFQPFIYAASEITYFRFKVFDRWGSQVFETNDVTKRWNGRVKDRLASNGVYVWHLEYKLVDTNSPINIESGEVIIIR